MRAWCLLLMLALAGCLDGPDPSAGGGDEASEAEGAATPSAPEDAGQPGSAPEQVELVDESWFLHNTITCTEGLCNCGSHEYGMDRTDREGDCDAMGGRGIHDSTATCGAYCYPSGEPMSAFPAGSSVAGTIYLTNDAADSATITVELLQGGVVLGGATVESDLFVGAAGFEWQAVPFEFTLMQGVGNATVMFSLAIEANESHFIGYEDDHASYFEMSA